MSDPDVAAQDAKREAQRNHRWAVFWHLTTPPVLFLVFAWYFWDWSWVEQFMFGFLSVVSIVALAETYSSKSKALEAKAASYENP